MAHKHQRKRMKNFIFAQNYEILFVRYMYVQYQPGISDSNNYPYQENEQHSSLYKCRYNGSSSVAAISGYGRILPGNETLLRDVVASVGPVAFAMNGDLDSFVLYK